MASKKFATMLHKNNHRIIVIIVYAFLEWILIFLIILNSLFSFLIEKFAEYFGLEPPCSWCSRSINRILDSEQHTNLHRDSFCEAHGIEISKLSYCSKHRRIVEQKDLCSNCSCFQPFFGDQNAEENIQYCCCCNEILIRNSNPYPPQLFKDSWDFLEYLNKRASSMNLIDGDNTDEISKFEDKRIFENDGEQTLASLLFDDDSSSSTSSSDILYNLRNSCLTYPSNDDESLFIVEKLHQNSDYMDSDRFICIELVDNGDVHEDRETTIFEEAKAFNGEGGESSKVNKDGSSSSLIDDYEIENQEEARICKELVLDAEFTNPTIENDGCEEKPDKFPGVDGEDEDTSIQTNESKHTKHDTGLRKKINLEPNDLDEAVEITMIDILHQLEKKIMKFGTENSITITEMEVDYECELTAELLLPLLRTQQKAMKALFGELEEERKSATETMAVINKLQEEKASIQTEALQYRRMMEEQAEYDQEAIQLLNDIMKKREKEKQELEKELQIYRHCESREKISNFRSKSTNPSVSLSENYNDFEDLEDEVEVGLNSQVEIPDISLAEFDEERLCILEELKSLEDKLFNEEGLKEMSKKSSSCVEEEIGIMHERIRAFEDDRQFIKNCVSSMMKGNEGIVLVQEILKNLRDLRAVELSYNKCVLREKKMEGC